MDMDNEIIEKIKAGESETIEFKKSTDSVYRKLFPEISGETARLDLNDMIKKDIIKKIGTTKGVYYAISPNLSPNYSQISKDIQKSRQTKEVR